MSTTAHGPTLPFASLFERPNEEAVEFFVTPAGWKATARMRRQERAMECVLMQ